MLDHVLATPAAEARAELNRLEQTRERGLPGHTGGNEKTAHAVDHCLAIGTDVRRHARQRSSRVLQQLERTLAACPFVVRERHQADVGRCKTRDLALDTPRYAIDCNLRP